MYSGSHRNLSIFALYYLVTILDKLDAVVNGTKWDLRTKHRRCFIIVEKGCPISINDPRRGSIIEKWGGLQKVFLILYEDWKMLGG